MAVNFADVWKSHILQDFRFPQKFPQGDMYAEALSFAKLRPHLSPKRRPRVCLTLKLPRGWEYATLKSRAVHAERGLAGKPAPRAGQTRRALRCRGCGMATG